MSRKARLIVKSHRQNTSDRSRARREELASKPSSSQISERTCPMAVRKVVGDTRVNPRTGWPDSDTGMDMISGPMTCSVPVRTSTDVNVRCLKSSLCRIPYTRWLSADHVKHMHDCSWRSRVEWPSGDATDKPLRPLYTFHELSGAHCTSDRGTMSDATSSG